MVTMRVELPWPSPKLAPNRRNGKHWTVTHAAKLDAFGAAATLTMQAQRSTGYEPPMDGPVALVLTMKDNSGTETRVEMMNELALFLTEDGGGRAE